MLQLRRVKESDVDLIFRWANDKECRENSFSIEPILYEEHCNWFAKRLKDKNSDLFVLEEELPIGMLRLDYQDDYVRISYSIAKEFRGKGYGKKILMLAEEFVQKRRNENWLKAQVKKENDVSRHLFVSLGYIEIEEDIYMEYQKKIIDNNSEIS